MAKLLSGRRRSCPLPLLACFALAAAMLLAAPAPPARGSAAPTTVSARAATAATASNDSPVASAASAPAFAPVFTVDGLMGVNRWLRPGEFVWDDERAPAGRVTIVVDLGARLLSVYRSGVEIGRSSIIYGAGDKPTPTGAFPILEKDPDHHSSLYYNAPMPHMLRLTNDGVSIHGSAIADDLASHGCIGLPKEFAALLFKAAKVGDRVLISSSPKGGDYTYYAALPRETALD